MKGCRNPSGKGERLDPTQTQAAEKKRNEKEKPWNREMGVKGDEQDRLKPPQPKVVARMIPENTRTTV